MVCLCNTVLIMLAHSCQNVPNLLSIRCPDICLTETENEHPNQGAGVPGIKRAVKKGSAVCVYIIRSVLCLRQMRSARDCLAWRKGLREALLCSTTA